MLQFVTSILLLVKCQNFISVVANLVLFKSFLYIYQLFQFCFRAIPWVGLRRALKRVYPSVLYRFLFNHSLPVYLLCWLHVRLLFIFNTCLSRMINIQDISKKQVSLATSLLSTFDWKFLLTFHLRPYVIAFPTF